MDRHGLPATANVETTESHTLTAQPAPAETTGSTSQHVQIITPESGDSNETSGRDTRGEGSSTAADRHLLSGSEGYPTLPRSQDNPYLDFERVLPPPPSRSRDSHARGLSRRTTAVSQSGLPQSGRNVSGIDWIVPVEEKAHEQRTVGERLQPTIDHAVLERDKYAKKALWTGYALNIAIGLQVFLGALTTGLAAAVSNPRHESIFLAQIATSILGGLSTMVASYLARARGSNEPELSITRVKDLEQFLRESKAFQMDHAHEYGSHENGLNSRLEDLRRGFESLLGNANGERKLSPVGIS
ncbi:hypothetical protein PAXRUDRAFT_34482 [Paxillus rubicundulus Ve08.2h10]|uniref:SMODS and SLOG-associating 2TM effector domain-containing protein n=1 Tax=Paxillus rubicundulus Ve08.2h10 TaxID=930991 RepID=A0A0D0E544_9AGAM|nr:hypothetical protein PAXRUDRAFT_34482 [Paxillus rubicundulus Ve08.2h10]